jgi:hypothetical protein
VSKLFVIRCQLPLQAGKREQPSRGVYDARPLKRSGDCVHASTPSCACDGVSWNEACWLLFPGRFQTMDLRGYHLRFERESKREKAFIHLLEPWEILFPDGKAVAEQALDIALTMQLGVAAAEAKRQTNPAYRVTFSKEGILFLHKKVGYPAVRPLPRQIVVTAEERIAQRGDETDE